MTRCPACARADLLEGPPSRTTGRVVGRCRSCGAQVLTRPLVTTVDLISSEDISADDYESWVNIKREGVGEDAWREATAWIVDAVGRDADRPRRLFDVGAGDGGYLRLAREEFGFTVTGNEVIEGAVILAEQQHDVELQLGDLADLGHQDEFDAVTLWCVLAHVPNGDDLLRNVHTMLRPGGVVFLQTPHRTAADRVGQVMKSASRGRWSTVTDRRLAGMGHHRILHTRASITALLERIGFTEVEVEPQVRYSMASQAYLVSIHTPGWAIRPASWVMDKAVAGGAVPRITLDVRARKPR